LGPTASIHESHQRWEARMKTRDVLIVVALVAVSLTLTLSVAAGWFFKTESQPRLDADRIGQAAGTKATTTADGLGRISWARNDVAVQVDGMPMKPFAGLGTWAAFTATEHGAMVMGDTVVFQDEVTPAMDAAFANGLEVNALHNHFFFDEPKVY